MIQVYVSDLVASSAPGLVGGPRPEHHGSPASSMISASAAAPQLVASYPQSYLQYSQVIQALPPHFHGQVSAACSVL